MHGDRYPGPPVTCDFIGRAYYALMEFEPTIGLEIHAELKTRTKMFCGSKNDPDESRANQNICPVCLAHPGTLPVINREAVRHVLRVGVALGSTLADYTEFDRKNYFYPDLPKGYQLSQFAYPLVVGGELQGVAITRVHLEEDTASSIHSETSHSSTSGQAGATVIDYNRAGVPLMELVTEPVIRSAEEAGRFARELQLLLRYIGASDANMEKGEMRVEANVSVAPKGERSTGYVEIKNLNSFRTMERAILYEIQRQEEVLRNGGVITKQTLGWDEQKQATFPQRTKEGSADYRYFPDPDLPSLKISEIPELSRDILVQTLPELPWQRRNRYIAAGIKPEDAELYVRDDRFGSFFDAVSEGRSAETNALASNYIANDLVKIVRDIEQRDTNSLAEVPISVSNFSKIITMLSEKKLSSKAAKDVLVRTVESGEDPIVIAEQEGLTRQVDASALSGVVAEVMEENPVVVADYRAGKQAALEFLLGQCMKKLRGAGDPVAVREALAQALG